MANKGKRGIEPFIFIAKRGISVLIKNHVASAGGQFNFQSIEIPVVQDME
jgi:hypothetical protein